MGKKKGDEGDTIGEIISKPHPHDVLCGRGGLTNQHTGNEWFRRLVRSNRPLYRSCPKHTKLLVAKAIVQAVQQQEPAGRFLEVADRNEGLWRQISYKRAVDKTSQALREKDPPPGKGGGSGPSAAMPAMDPPLQLPNSNIQNEAAAAARAAASKKGRGKKSDADLKDLAKATLKQAGFIAGEGQNNKVTPASAILNPPVDLGNNNKRKPPPTKSEFVKPSWWGRSPGDQGGLHNQGNMMGVGGRPEKRMKTDDVVPPPEPLQTRQSSLFRFLSNTSIFGGVSDQQKEQQQQPQLATSNSFFAFSSGNNNSNNNNNMLSQQGFQSGDNNGGNSIPYQGVAPPTNQPLQMGSSTFLLDPLPISNSHNSQGSTGTQQRQQQQMPNSVGGGSQPNNQMQQQMQRQQMQERMIQMQQHMQQQMQMQMESLRRQQQQQQQSQRSGGGGNNDTCGGDFLPKASSNTPLRSALRSSLVVNKNDVFGAKNTSNSGMANPLEPNSFPGMPTGGDQKSTSEDPTGAPPPANNRLTSQVSDWLTSFFPLGNQPAAELPSEELPSPEPLADNLERSVSSTLINFARSPSQFLTSLRTGVSSMFGDTNSNNNNINNSSVNNSNNNGSNTAAAARTSFEVNNNNNSSSGGNNSGNNDKTPVLGTESRGDSLLDDYEESPMETRLRMGISQ